MKKVLLTLTLAATIASAYGQGSVAFSNGALYRHSIWQSGFPDAEAQVPVPTTPGLLKYGLWYGVGSAAAVDTSAAPWVIGVNSTVYPGAIVSAVDGTTFLNNVSLGPETSVNESDIWMQIIGWSAQYPDWQSARAAWLDRTPDVLFATTEVMNILPLGNPLITGSSIWQGTTTSYPKRFYPLEFVPVPEPTTMVLAGLGAVALLVARRRK